MSNAWVCGVWAVLSTVATATAESAGPVEAGRLPWSGGAGAPPATSGFGSANGTGWIETHIAPATSQGNAFFGYTLTTDGDDAYIAAPGMAGASGSGVVYVYHFAHGAWTETEQLTAADARQFGIGIAVSGDTLLIGANTTQVGANANQGAAYVFTRTAGKWSAQGRLTAADGVAGDLFGQAVALEGGTALIGAPGAKIGANTYQGAAYVYTAANGAWTQAAKLVAADGAANDYFGRSLALGDGSALVFSYANAGGGFVGATYTYESATHWAPAQKLTGSVAPATSVLGYGMRARGAKAVLGAPMTRVGDVVQGAAYLYTHAGGVWTRSATFTAADGIGGDWLGEFVDFDDDRVLLATARALYSRGGAYLYRRNGANWDAAQKFVAGDGAAGDMYGWSLGLTAQQPLVAAYCADAAGTTCAGTVYAYRSDRIFRDAFD